VNHILTFIYEHPHMNIHIWTFTYDHAYMNVHIWMFICDCSYMNNHIWTLWWYLGVQKWTGQLLSNASQVKGNPQLWTTLFFAMLLHWLQRVYASPCAVRTCLSRVLAHCRRPQCVPGKRSQKHAKIRHNTPVVQHRNNPRMLPVSDVCSRAKKASMFECEGLRKTQL